VFVSGSLRSTILLFAAGALCVFAAPALAQTAKDKILYNPAVYDDGPYDDEVVVIAPGVAREHTGRRTSSGARIETLRVSHAVDASDLDLRYDAAARELRRRVHATVVDSCLELEAAMTGVALDNRRDCIRHAERDAMAQADRLIYSSRG
jgi:UrcA family protein